MAACDSGAFETQPTGNFTVEKITLPAGGTDIDFLGTGFPEGCDLMDMFTLNDTETLSCILPLGMFMVEEAASLEYELYIMCTETPSGTTPTSVTIDIGSGDDVTCTFTNTGIFTLDVTLAGTGTGAGNVMSNPPGIDCGNGGTDCVGNFNFDTEVTLIPTSDMTSSFGGFSGDLDCEDGMIDPIVDTSCTATFNFIPGLAITLLPVDPGQARVVNTLSVTQATPGGQVGFIYGFTQQAGVDGSSICPGLEVDILNFRTLFTLIADGSGAASGNVFVPANAAGVTIFMQAVDLSSCAESNVNQEDF